jgi:hypothetical protein
VHGESFCRLGNRGQNAGEHVVGQEVQAIHAEAAHQFVGQVDGRELGGPGGLDVGDERRPVIVGRLVIDRDQAGGGAVATSLAKLEGAALAIYFWGSF